VNDTWSRADLHIHSDNSDGLARIPQIMDHVQEHTDLKVIAITDHNTMEGARFAKSLEDLYDFEVVMGEEISSKHGHVIGLFIEEHVPAGMSAVKTIAEINAQGGVAIIPHPFSAQGVFGPLGFRGIADKIGELAFSALEVYNSMPFLVYANSVASRVFGAGRGVASVGGSDAHMLKAIGKGSTRFRGETAEDLRESIARLETRAEAGRGNLAMAVRYMLRFPSIRRQQAWNWERCRP
jgi:predicted metal-dependent phosphoesterase TrpH